MSARTNERGWRQVALGALMVASTSCGGLSQTVDRRLLRDIGIENKLQLFEAENEVSIALDEREQLVREGQRLQRQVALTEAQRSDAEDDGKRASSKGDTKAEALAKLAVEVLGLKLAYLEEALDLLDERLDAQERLTQVALAKFELAKAKIVKRNNVSGASGLDLADFEEQVDGCVAQAKVAQQDLARVEKGVDEARARWIAAREKLQKQSGGGLGSTWAEDTPTWGWQ
mgnify:CR=1 FL=1